MVVLDRWLEIAIALLRVAVGVIFLWAGPGEADGARAV